MSTRTTMDFGTHLGNCHSSIADNLVGLLMDDAPVPRILKAIHDVDCGVDEQSLPALRNAIIGYSFSSKNAPLVMLSLGGVLQAEIALFTSNKIPGIDRTAYLKATPAQVVRKLTGDTSGDNIAELLRRNYDFARFKKENWEEYFSRCSALFPAAQSFLARDEANGGFSEAMVTGLLLRNPLLVSSVPCGRISPDTAVALLISGRAEVLWTKYDFTRLTKEHWRELFLHTNPGSLPDACRPYVENKDGRGFSDGELLELAWKCYALINFLNPNKVPFNVAYELYQTGRADLLWKNYPFASLDKSEWRRILSNPSVRIPDMFLDVVRSGRFSLDELCGFAIKNDRLFPFLINFDIPIGRLIGFLSDAKSDYLWEHYDFNKLSPDDWVLLILALKGEEILRPKALKALTHCKGVSEVHVTAILKKNPAYCPYLPVSAILPGTAVEMLMQGEGDCLWKSYDFKRLDDDLWLRLLENTKGVVPQLGKDFLQYRSGAVDNARLNIVLSRRKDLIEFVDAKYIAPDLAVSILMTKPRHKLWDRFDFMRLDAKQLMRVISAHEYVSGTFPKSLQECFKKEGEPFSFSDLLELAAINPCIVVDNISTEWVESLDDSSFEKLVSLAVSNDSGVVSLRKRLNEDEKPWNTLSRSKLKQLLALAPELRFSVGWDTWAFRDIAELAKSNTAFERGIAHPVRYFIWKHFKSLFAMGALTTAAIVAICLHNSELDRQEARRQYLNSIVQSVKKFDQERSYRTLNEFWKTIALDDRAFVKDDLFVKRAFVNLTAWEADRAAIESGMYRLREMSKAGWGTVTKEAVEAVIEQLEKRHVDHYTDRLEFQSLKSAHAEYRKLEAERTRIKSLRDQLVEIKINLMGCEDLAQLAEWKVFVNSLASEKPLEDEVTKAREKLNRQIDFVQAKINAERLAQEVATISNMVASVLGEMKRPTAVINFPTWSAEYLRIKKMPGFDEYGKLPCYEAYDRLSEDYKKFDDLRRGAADKLAEAKMLDAKFSKEFMTEEGGTACSNVVSYCDEALKMSKSKDWLALSRENEKIKKVIEEIYDRDLRCWSLVDKVNAASDYAIFYEAKADLIKEFGHFDQFRHLSSLCDIEPSDLRSYKESSAWGWGTSYKYYFVGVIRLQPESPSRIVVETLPGKTMHNADLYALSKTSSGVIVSEKIITKKGWGRYYKVSGIDYTNPNRQGSPLFVRSEHYMGKED